MDLTQAAQERAKGVRQQSHRPSQRSSSQDGAPAVVRFAARGMDLRETSESNLLTFEGFATTYGQAYEMYDMFGPYREIVEHGAAAKSLAREDLDVPLVLQHDAMRRIARTTNGSLSLVETDEGLHVLADQLDPTDVDVAYIAPKIRSGLIDEMSFKFTITRGQWSPDFTEYRIQEFDIHRGDVAIVGYGANPHTSGALREEHNDHIERDRTALDLAIAL